MAKSGNGQGASDPQFSNMVTIYTEFKTDPGAGARVVALRVDAGAKAGYVILRSEGVHGHGYSGSGSRDRALSAAGKIDEPMETLDRKSSFRLPFKILIFESGRREMDGELSPSLDFVNRALDVQESREEEALTLGSEEPTEPLSNGSVYMPASSTERGIADLAEDGQTGKLLIPMPLRTVACPCNQVFCNVYEFEIHMERAHMGIDVKYTCDLCGKHCLRVHGAKYIGRYAEVIQFDQ